MGQAWEREVVPLSPKNMQANLDAISHEKNQQKITKGKKHVSFSLVHFSITDSTDLAKFQIRMEQMHEI